MNLTIFYTAYNTYATSKLARFSAKFECSCGNTFGCWPGIAKSAVGLTIVSSLLCRLISTWWLRGIC